jgi:6-methylsalicylic acid synthase
MNSEVAKFSLANVLDDIAQGVDESVAIIGMGCRFPGAVASPAEFWQFLVDGRDAVRAVPGDRWAPMGADELDMDTELKDTMTWWFPR